jgi:hypothetical protein
MESPAHSPSPARNLRGPAPWVAMPRRAVILSTLAAALLISGCGERVGPPPPPASLVTGRRAVPLPPAQLAAATSLARSFARSWVPTIYKRRPPRLPGTTSSVRRAQLLEASRVPDPRRHLRPRLAGLKLTIAADRRIAIDLVVVDGHSPAFSLGATLARRPSGWRIVTISAPG